MAVATKQKVCTRLIHNGVERVKCDTKYTGAECPKRNSHVLKFKTGFCVNGWHEGTKPTVKGKPVKTCPMWMTCGCDCHVQLDVMYKMAEMERAEVPNPEYVPAPRTYWMPSDDPEYWAPGPLSSPDGTDTPPWVEGTVDTPSRDATGLVSGPHGFVEPRFAPTPTGRRARGQLEYDVLTVCEEFSRDVYEWEYCTPKLVAERIGKMNETEPPSTGAINAVWDRWEKLDFAVQDKKPSRFVCFKDGLDGSPRTLEMMKLRAKQSKKRDQAAAKRGTLRSPVR